MPIVESGRSPRRQTILIFGAAFAGAMVLFLVWFFMIRAPYAPAFESINSTDALTITQELDSLKIPYVLTDDGTTISVPENQVDMARINILGSDLPLKGAVGFELFNQSDMGLTEFAQKINYQRALQGELARTIMALEEVETARVHLSLPETGIFEQDRRPAKASITVATKLGGPIDDTAVRGIQQLVASAVPDLQVGNVAILDARGMLLSATPVEVAAVALTPEQQQRQVLEQSIGSRVEDAVRKAGLAMPLSVKVTALKSFSANSADVQTQDAETGVARDYPLNIQLGLASLPGAAISEKLTRAARDAIVFDASLGDVVAVVVDPSLGAVSPPAAQGTRRADWSASETRVSESSRNPFWVFVIFLVIALVGLGFLFTRRRPTVGMNAQQREDFAEKLKSLLDREAGNGRTAS